jgi:bifunctional non-homologous end joining protein LigD
MPTMLSSPPGPQSPAAPPGIDPIVPVSRADPFDGAQWMFEPSYDGLRGFLHASAAECAIRSQWITRFEGYVELCARVARVIGGRDVILDGDIVSLDARGRPVFRDLLKGRGFLAFAASDLLWLDGLDLRPLPLAERKRRLADLLPLDTGPLYKVFTLVEHGRALFEATRKMELDGILAKRLSDPYGPETVWYRIKNPAYRQADGGLDLPASLARSRAPERGVTER